MKVLLAAFFVASAALGIASVNAQQAPTVTDNTALQKIMETELPPERMALAMKLVQLNGTTRVFDDILPTIADEAKNQFIRANPQMQLGIIGLVDTIAVQLVSRRPELDRYLARIWASGFTDEEMQSLIDFFGTDVGKKYASRLPGVLAVQTSAAQEWGRSVAAELNVRVQEELRAAITAEENALQSDIAGPAETLAPAPAQ